MTCQHCGELIPEKRQQAIIRLSLAASCLSCAESNPAPLLRGAHEGYEAVGEDSPVSDLVIFAPVHGVYSYGRVNVYQQERRRYA